MLLAHVLAAPQRHHPTTVAPGTLPGRAVFYHYHIPKTAGTAASLLTLQAVCGNNVSSLLDSHNVSAPSGLIERHRNVSDSDNVSAARERLSRLDGFSRLDLDFTSACSQTCANAKLVDTELACLTGHGSGERPAARISLRLEHVLWWKAKERISTLLWAHPSAHSAVSFASVREPVARTVSHWLHCVYEYLKWGQTSSGGGRCTQGAGEPPKGVRYLSNASFAHFLSAHAHGPSPNWVGTKATSFFRTANMQLGMLASVAAGTPVERKHLEQVQRMLCHEGEFAHSVVQWIVGTSDDLTGLFRRVAKAADMPHSEQAARAWRTEANSMHTAGVHMDSLVLQHKDTARQMNSLDDELYRWVRDRYDQR